MYRVLYSHKNPSPLLMEADAFLSDPECPFETLECESFEIAKRLASALVSDDIPVSRVYFGTRKEFEIRFP